MKIVLAVTSSIAAYKVCDLLRMFGEEGYDTHVIMSERATHLIAPLVFETLSGNTVYTSMWDRDKYSMPHISIRENASLYLVAPATANIIGKMACGIADDLVSTTFLSVKCPVAVAPAMNPVMWENRAVVENVETLKRRGITIIEPAFGKVACNDVGHGRLADVTTIFEKTKSLI